MVTSLVMAGAPRMLPDLVNRSRLRDALRPLAAVTVVRGPGGAGKTVVMSQLISDLIDEHGVWLTVDRGTATRPALWGRVMSELQGADAAERMFGGERIESHVLARGLRNVGRRLLIVIDDAHLISDAQVFDDILDVAERVPEVSFVIATRTLLATLEDPSRALTVDIRVLPPHELAFTTREIAAFAGVDDETAEQYRDLTDGSPLLLRAVLLGARRHLGDDAASGGIEVLRGHLRRYVDGIDPAAQGFMRRTCWADDFSLAEAAELTGHPHPRLFAHALESDGLLTRHGDDRDERWRYHPLVREFLRQDAAAVLPTEAIVAAHRIIARSRAVHHENAAALRHALLGRDHHLATQVLLHGGIDLLAECPYELIAAIPRRTLARHPILAAARGLKEDARGASWAAKEFLALAGAASRNAPTGKPGERATMTVLESVAARLQGRPADAADAAERALVLIDGLRDDSSLWPQVHQLLAECAVSFFRAGHSTLLQNVLGRIPPQDPRSGLVAASLKAVAAALEGDWPELARIEEAVLASGWTEDVLQGSRGALLTLARMLRDLARADTEGVRELLHAIGARHPTIEFRPLFAAVHAVAALVDGDPDESARILDAARRTEPGARRLSPRDAEVLAFVESLALAASGAIDAAAARLPEVRGGSVWTRLLRAHHSLLCGDVLTATGHLAAAAVTSSSAPRVVRMRSLLLAWAALERGDARAVQASLRRAGAVVASVGEDGSLMLLPFTVRERLRDVPSVDSDAFDLFRDQLDVPLPAPFTPQLQHPRLSKRERVVLGQLADFGTNADIANELGISPNTVKTQLRSAYRKLGVSDRHEALARMAALSIGDAETAS